MQATPISKPVQPIAAWLRKQPQSTCTCQAYGFPHRATGGKCLARHDGPFCGDCGQPASATAVDRGYGRTEFWGSVSNHSDICAESRCCGADLFEDASLTREFDPPVYRHKRRL